MHGFDIDSFLGRPGQPNPSPFAPHTPSYPQFTQNELGAMARSIRAHMGIMGPDSNVAFAIKHLRRLAESAKDEGVQFYASMILAQLD